MSITWWSFTSATVVVPIALAAGAGLHELGLAQAYRAALVGSLAVGFELFFAVGGHGELADLAVLLFGHSVQVRGQVEPLDAADQHRAYSGRSSRRCRHGA
jgi:hypothetical protein